MSQGSGAFTHDEAQFETFCSQLVEAGFSPTPGAHLKSWTGPLRNSLAEFTDSTRMEIRIRDGWPLKYAYIIVPGISEEHASAATICLWHDDDPAQVNGRDLSVLFERLDAWALLARTEFSDADHALDAYLSFNDQSGFVAELPLADLIRGSSNGRVLPLGANPHGTLLSISTGTDQMLRGVFYQRGHARIPPRNLDEFRAALSQRQLVDLSRGLSDRNIAQFAEPSGGLDFAVLTWPRHDSIHDALVLVFHGAGDALKSGACAPSPTDAESLLRRAGPDASRLAGKRILIVGAGSVGGHVAVGLATCGATQIDLRDDDILKSVNVVRPVAPRDFVGFPKTEAVRVTAEAHAPWCTITTLPALPALPAAIARAVDGIDLVVDCTGNFAVIAALAVACMDADRPLVTGALYRQGAISRIRRQADGDVPLALRTGNAEYIPIPVGPDDAATTASRGFLELGCSAPVDNAPPVAVLATAADLTAAAVDILTDRLILDAEQVKVLRPLPGEAPFDVLGAVRSTTPAVAAKHVPADEGPRS